MESRKKVWMVLFLGMLIFSSCTKALKDDLRRLQQQYDDISHALGHDEPISPTTIFKDKNGKTVTITDNYKLKADDYTTQSLIKLADGTYYVYIERFLDIRWSEGLKLSFNYNPSSKAISHQEVRHYWADEGDYNAIVIYDLDVFNKGLNFNINLRKLDIATGEISMDVKIEGTEEYGNNAPYSFLPRIGTPVSTSFSFTGKLRVF